MTDVNHLIEQYMDFWFLIHLGKMSFTCKEWLNT